MYGMLFLSDLNHTHIHFLTDFSKIPKY